MICLAGDGAFEGGGSGVTGSTPEAYFLTNLAFDECTHAGAAAQKMGRRRWRVEHG